MELCSRHGLVYKSILLNALCRQGGAVYARTKLVVRGWKAESCLRDEGINSRRFEEPSILVQTAHYLIQTHLERRYGIAPALDVGPYAVGPMRKRHTELGTLPLPKRARFGRPASRHLPVSRLLPSCPWYHCHYLSDSFCETAQL